MSIADEFVLLTSFGDQPGDGGIKTRSVSIDVPGGSVLIALDNAGGRHLLVPVRDEQVAEDMQSRHVTVSERTLVNDAGGLLRFVDLACSDTTLGRVFEQLVEDVVARLLSGTPAETVCQTALDDWRDLLRRSAVPISREKALGLFGELTVLEVLAETDPVRAVNTWIGPSKRPQDFMRNGRAIEVKTTASVDGSTIRVSNIDQLDPRDLDRLDLVVIHVREDDSGTSLDDLLDRVLRLGVPRRKLMAAVESEGYIYGSNAPFNFSVRSCRSWLVGDDFPSMRVADIDPSRRPAIGNIAYDLTLTVEPTGHDIAEVRLMLDRWTA